MPQTTEWLMERWRTMFTIRRAEETIAEMLESGEVRGPCHLYIGQEAVAAGVCAALDEGDTVWGGHRSHGHYLAKGGSLFRLFAEVLGKRSGCSGARGGSMHLLAKEAGILGTVPIVGGTVPLAVGAAFAAKLRASAAFEGHSRASAAFEGHSRASAAFEGDSRASAAHEKPPRERAAGERATRTGADSESDAFSNEMRTAARPLGVAASFFGDGTLEEGHVHESFNLAAIYKLPVVFVCENNLYSSHMHWSERRIADNLYRAGEFHSVPGERVDGNDVEAVHKAAERAVGRARDGGGPSFIECRTFRWRGHVGPSFDLDVGVKRRGELSDWLLKDPVRRLEERLAARGAGELTAQKIAVEREVETAASAARAEADPLPRPKTDFVWREAACAG